MGGSSFKITISGTDVLPETTSISDLTEFLVKIETAISETGKAQGVEMGEGEIVSLTRIDRSSNKLTFSVAAILLSSAVSVSQAVEINRYEELPRQAHKALHEV